MSHTKDNIPYSPGVGCDVKSCKYHSKDNLCTANRINVASENAMRKAETFCATFTPRATT
jgi:hypothetical protein